MKYDLSQKGDRLKFIKRANSLLKSKKTLVSLLDESQKTINQNSYIHVLCRIMAAETGTTEHYAKQVYFKELANQDLFIRITKDPITNTMVKTIRSICDLTTTEITKAIVKFISWAAEQGYTMPVAEPDSEGNMVFKDDTQKEIYNKAEIETSKLIEL